jgi:cephalosporin hydroxylase
MMVSSFTDINWGHLKTFIKKMIPESLLAKYHHKKDAIERKKIECLTAFCHNYNAILDKLSSPATSFAGIKDVDDIIRRSTQRSDINDHLLTIYLEVISAQPALIVELGVRGGESNFVLAKAAARYNANFISVDLEDCSAVCNYDKWFFIQADDLVFADNFVNFCRSHAIEPQIDVLFIDTSHLYDHTCEEIRLYFPFLSNKAKVFFHDTHLTNIFQRRDGSLGVGWDNNRGVIRALEGCFMKKFNEKKAFCDYAPPFVIKHFPHCCGLTILEKLEISSEAHR